MGTPRARLAGLGKNRKTTWIREGLEALVRHLRGEEKLRHATRQSPGAWCQNALARCALGRPVSPHSREAVARCGVGALRTVGPHLAPETLAALRAAAGPPFAVWQDLPGRTQAEVLDVFDRAIAGAML